jgi:hypothetical protein
MLSGFWVVSVNESPGRRLEVGEETEIWLFVSL